MTPLKLVGHSPLLELFRHKMAARRSRNAIDRARKLLASNRQAEALETYQKAEAILPLPPAALSDVVGILAKAKRYDDAAPYARRLLRDNPRSRRALRALARVSEVGPEVLAGWRELAQASPGEVEPWLQIARIALRLQDFNAAIEAAERVLGFAPNHSEAKRVITSAARAKSRRLKPTQERIEADAEDERLRLEAIDHALREGDISTAAVLLNPAHSSGVEFDRRTRMLRAILAADAFSAEASGNIAAARLSYWCLKEITRNAPDYADGLNRCLFVDASVWSPPSENDELPTSYAPSVVDLLAEERLIQAESLARSGRLSAAKDHWRDVQPIVRSATLRRYSQRILIELQDRILEQLAAANNAGDGANAWELVDILKGLGRHEEAQSAATSLLPQTLQMLRTLPAEKTALIIQLSRRYLGQKSDPAVSTRLGKALMKEGRHAEALPIWENLIARKPEQIGYWLQIARCARRLHRSDLGLVAVERLLDLNEKHAEGLRLAAHFGLPSKRAGLCAE